MVPNLIVDSQNKIQNAIKELTETINTLDFSGSQSPWCDETLNVIIGPFSEWGIRASLSFGLWHVHREQAKGMSPTNRRILQMDARYLRQNRHWNHAMIWNVKQSFNSCQGTVHKWRHAINYNFWQTSPIVTLFSIEIISKSSLTPP